MAASTQSQVCLACGVLVLSAHTCTVCGHNLIQDRLVSAGIPQDVAKLAVQASGAGSDFHLALNLARNALEASDNDARAAGDMLRAHMEMVNARPASSTAEILPVAQPLSSETSSSATTTALSGSSWMCRACGWGNGPAQTTRCRGCGAPKAVATPITAPPLPNTGATVEAMVSMGFPRAVAAAAVAVSPDHEVNAAITMATRAMEAANNDPEAAADILRAHHQASNANYPTAQAVAMYPGGGGGGMAGANPPVGMAVGMRAPHSSVPLYSVRCRILTGLLLLCLIVAVIVGVLYAVHFYGLGNRPPGGTASNLPTNSTYNLTLSFAARPTSMPASVYSSAVGSFNRAAYRWHQVITTSLPTSFVLTVEDAASACHATISRATPVEDILLFIHFEYIDNLGGILGQSGPCLLDANHMPRVATIVFDEVDVASQLSSGQFDAISLHEMGHCLGFGTLWETTRYTLLTPQGQVPIQYLGTNGQIGEQEVFGDTVPIVEDTGGAGTARGHWKETIYTNELMTGYLSGTSQPLSVLSIRSFQDLGYNVDLTRADGFGNSPGGLASGRRRLRPGLEAEAEATVALGADIRPGPIYQSPDEGTVKPGMELELMRLRQHRRLTMERHSRQLAGGPPEATSPPPPPRQHTLYAV